MEPLKSKVMEGLGVAWFNHYHHSSIKCYSPVGAEYDIGFIESQIRAAIMEFCEMAEINNLAYIMDHTESENHSSWVDVVKEALAAFGVSEK